MSWVLFSIIAAFLWAIVNNTDKYVVTKLVRNPMTSMMVLGVVGLGASIIVYLVHGFSPLSYGKIAIALGAGTLYALMNILYFLAVQREEISRVVPLFSLAPVYILIMASLFLGEILVQRQYLGVLMLVSGAILISIKKKLSFRKPFWLMVGSSLALAINQVMTKYLLAYADFWTVFAWKLVGCSIALTPILVLQYPDLLSAMRRLRVGGVIVLNEAVNLAGVIFFTAAVSAGLVTLANALTSLQPLFVLLIALFLSAFMPNMVKEDTGAFIIAGKFMAIALLIVGAFLVS